VCLLALAFVRLDVGGRLLLRALIMISVRLVRSALGKMKFFVALSGGRCLESIFGLLVTAPTS